MTRIALLTTLFLCACQSASPAPTTNAEPSAAPAPSSTWQILATSRLDPQDSGPGESYSVTVTAPDAAAARKDASAPKH